MDRYLAVRGSLPAVWRRWWRSASAVTVLVAVVGLLVAAGVGAVLARGQRRAAEQQMQRRAAIVVDAVTAESRRYVDALTTVSSATGAFENLTAAKFAQVTAPLAGMGLAGATSIAYMVPVDNQHIDAVEAKWRSHGASDLQFAPGPGTQHIFSVFSRPLDGSTMRRTGIDAMRSVPASQALDTARRNGLVAISDPYQLLIDQQLPEASRQVSFAVTAPVYGPADARGQRPFRGWVLMGLRGRDFIAGTLNKSAQNLLDVSLQAPTTSGAYQHVADEHATTDGRRNLAVAATISVAGRDWQLQLHAAASTLPGGVTRAPMLTTLGLAFLDLVLAAFVWTLATGRARALRRVQTATADLAATERTARQQADLLTAIMDSISDGVRVIDHDGTVLLHNPAAHAIIGDATDAYATDSEAAAGPHQRGLYRPDHTAVPYAETPLIRALGGEIIEQAELLVINSKHPAGTPITISARPVRDGDGTGFLGAVAVFHDITARKQAEEELAAAHDALLTQQAYLTQILDAIDVTILTCDSSGTLAHANRAARRYVSTSTTPTLTELNMGGTLTHPGGAAIALRDSPLTRALTGEHIDAMETTALLPDGRHRSLLMHARPLHDHTGATTGAVAASYDVTALREREADLRAFAGVVAHDLKAPLAAIAGYAELIEDTLTETTDPTVSTSLTRISTGIDRMRRLIDDLLTYATTRDGNLDLQNVDLNQLTTDIITERTAHLRLAGADQAALFPDIHCGPLPTVHADPAMFRQLLDNLIGNAIKYALPGQAARVDIIGHISRDGLAHIIIADQGIGIPATDQPRIFDTFHRAANHGNRPGTGLGLAICKRIIDRHGGTITVTDNPGGGTCIQLTAAVANA